MTSHGRLPSLQAVSTLSSATGTTIGGERVEGLLRNAAAPVPLQPVSMVRSERWTNERQGYDSTAADAGTHPFSRACARSSSRKALDDVSAVAAASWSAWVVSTWSNRRDSWWKILRSVQ